MNENPRQEFRRTLLAWFDAHKRDLPWRKSQDPYRIWISEVMLQQTQAATVIPYYERFVDKYPDILTLAAAGLEDILKSWEKMGYYARARNLHRAARLVAREFDGRIPDTFREFRALPGVGDYIAAAVMSIAFNRRCAVVDGNVKRVIARLFLLEHPSNGPTAARKAFQAHAEELLDPTRPGDFNQALMELGATVCKPRSPACTACPIRGGCQARITGRQSELPVRIQRKKVPTYQVAVGVVRKDDRILITRRKDDGLLGGLWEFPGGKVRPGETPEAACLREIKEEVNLTIEITDYLAHVDHAYSHFKIGVDVFDCSYTAGSIRLSGPVDYKWILVDEIDDYAFPGANHKFIPILKSKPRS